MTQEILLKAIVSPDHPCLAGHFPHNPVVPGTLMLENIVKALTAHWPDLHVTEVSIAKFLSPLKPGQAYAIRISRQAATVDFECIRDDIKIANGRLAVRREAQPETAGERHADIPSP